MEISSIDSPFPGLKILEIHEEDLGRYPSLSKATHERIKRAMRDLSPDPDPDLPKT